ncbi:MAG: transketolase C-terminal domain-containing protein, partial [Clostridiales bacterium]
GYQAKMREPVTMYDPSERGIMPAVTEKFLGGEGIPGVDRIPAHLRNTYNTEDELRAVVEELNRAYLEAAPQVVEYETVDAEDADVLIIAHGVVTRAAKAAVKQLREQGIKAGHFRPITLRPFAAEALKPLAQKAKLILVAESSLGQLEKIVTNAIYGCTTPIEKFFKPGEGITDEELVEKVKAMKY